MGDLDAYRKLLAEVDTWFRSVQSRHGAHMKCGSGCSDCCHGAFDIGPHDVALVRAAFQELPSEIRAAVRETALAQVEKLGLKPPYEMDGMLEAEIDGLTEKLGPVPCPLLDPEGHCRIYNDRPSTCRFMGLPLIDAEEGIVHGEWCERNFDGVNPLQLPGIPFGYRSWEDDVEAAPVKSTPRYTFIACAILSDPVQRA
ncbi:MAG: YkgJ family cysteine cluster protein [Planctomycetes bacterium]|nr:YkgJ family cysteine cluster protein [Planctomycetota bacterium]